MTKTHLSESSESLGALPILGALRAKQLRPSTDTEVDYPDGTIHPLGHLPATTQAQIMANLMVEEANAGLLMCEEETEEAHRDMARAGLRLDAARSRFVEWTSLKESALRYLKDAKEKE